MKVIKRDGTKVPFDKSKIVTAINKALEEVDGRVKDIATSTSIASEIYESFIYSKKEMGVEEIQDMVELKLMQSERPDVAKAYILYRDKRTKERERKDRIIKTVIERNSASNVKNSNANVDEKSFSGREKEAASDIQKIIALDYTLSPEIGAAHKNMLLYQHDLEKTNLGVHNCFGRETKFITIDGVKSFEDFEDGDIVIVRDAYGNWKKAIVKNYGPQDLYLLTFKNGRCHQRTIRATANHRWILHDGSITENLKVGDRLLKAPQVYEEFNPDKYSTEELMMWCKGFGLGDGTVEYNQSKITGEYYKSNRTRIRLCGEKDNKWLPIFEKAGCRISNQTLENGDKIVTVPYYHKEIPEFKNIKEVLLFFNGLYAADGTQTSKSSAGKKMYNLQSSKLEIIDFIYKYADAIGMYISAERDLTGQVTNYGTRPYTITFSFKPDFSFSYKLIDKKIDSYEDVWCLEVEDTHSFLLANGIPTGNCLNLDFEELFSEEFVCRNGGVRPPQSIATAMSLVAVAFQCQSQTQFGGVGSVHIDLDLTPYVKKSFVKHYRDGLRYLLKWSTVKLQQEFDDYMIHFDYENKNITDAWFRQYIEAYEYAMDMLEREGQQAAEGLYHNLNTLESRAGSQVPFTSINTGRETTPEGRLITKWLMKASLNGIGSHHLTPIFPISIFQYKQGVNANPEDPNYDLKQLALKSLSKRIYPNFVNCDWSEAHEDPENPDTRMSTMGCRTMLGYDRHGLGYTRVGRGNNVPNTIILPKLGIEFGIHTGNRKKPDLEGFWHKFEETLLLAEKGLLERYEIMKKQTPEAAPFMYKNGTIKEGRTCKKTVENSLRHNTLAIG